MPKRCMMCLQVLTEELGGLVGALSFTRSMRWNSGTAFSRPVRWLLALHGSTVLPFQYAGLQAGERPPCSSSPIDPRNSSTLTGCEGFPALDTPNIKCVVW